jgi:uncharacterized membrane protein YfcA
MVIPDYPPFFWISAIVAIIFLGISKAGFGGGAGFLATPLMSLFIPVADAAALLLVLLIVIDFVMLPHYRHHFHRPSLTVLLAGALVGIVLGAFLFTAFSENERVLRIFIGMIALAYVAYYTFGLADRFNLVESRYFTPLGIIAGIAAGFTSTLAHAGGPPATIFLLPQKHSKQVFVGTMAILFTIVNLVKLIPYSFLGLLRVGNITTILLLSPFCFIGARIGIYLNRRFDPIWFTRIIYILLFLTGIQLLIGQNPVTLLINLFQ